MQQRLGATQTQSTDSRRDRFANRPGADNPSTGQPPATIVSETFPTTNPIAQEKPRSTVAVPTFKGCRFSNREKR